MHLDGKTKSIIEDILNRKAKIALQGEDIREDIKVVAERMGVRPAAANRIMTLVDKEAQQGRYPPHRAGGYRCGGDPDGRQ